MQGDNISMIAFWSWMITGTIIVIGETAESYFTTNWEEFTKRQRFIAVAEEFAIQHWYWAFVPSCIGFIIGPWLR